MTVWFVYAILACFALGLASLAGVAMGALGRAGELRRLRSNCETAGAGPRELDALTAALLEGLPPRGVAHRRVTDLVGMRNLGQSRPDAAALASLAEAEVARHLLLPRALAGVLVLLGLCGAVTGLLNVLPDVSTLIGEQAALVGDIVDLQTSQRESGVDPAAVERLKQKRTQVTEAFQGAMDHMRPAFEASIAGILTTVVLLLALSATEWASDKLVLTPLEEITATRLVPLLTASDDLSSLQEAVQVLTGTRDYLSQLADRMLDQSGQVEAQLSVLYSVIHQFETGSHEIARGHQEIREAHESTLATVRQFQTLATALAQDVGEGSKRSREILARLDRTLVALDRVQEEGKLNRESAAAGLQRTLGILQETQEQQFTALTKAVAGGSGGDLAEAVRGLGQRLEELQKTSEATRAAVAGLAGAMGQEVRAALAGAPADQARALQPMLEKLGGVAAGLDAAAGRLAAAGSYPPPRDGASLIGEGRPVVADGDLRRLVTVLERMETGGRSWHAEPVAPAEPAPPEERPSDPLVRVGAAAAGSTLTVTGLLWLVQTLPVAELAGAAVVVALTTGLAWWRGARS